MAFIAAPMPAKSILGFRNLSTTIAGIPTPCATVLQLGFKVPPPSTPSNFRFRDAIRLREKQRLPVVFASNTNPSGNDSAKEKIETSDSAQGPPFLTILAGFVVFFLVFWVLGSIIAWLVGLIVNLPPSK